ncbi:gliding motility-associated C-terminal domain-containing protein [Larkinella sp. VNQ87]|uniref:gliding motility-associated C-terminal domain-containing protein n=1 Tax=Larkinella sp. VNQ87 TaxID=3400921 RepID=UPI003C048EC6
MQTYKKDAGWIAKYGIPLGVFLLFVISTCRAQSDQCIPTAGQFSGSLQISPGIGCLPLTIKASSSLRGVKNVRYVFEYQGGAVKETDLKRDSVYTYRKAGLYRVLQYSEQEGRQLRACAIVQVYDTLPPEVSTTSCLNHLSLTIPKAADYQYDWYEVKWGDGTSERLDGAKPFGAHAYPDDSPREITVQGVHLYGMCGGTTRLRFRPVRSSTSPVIEGVKAIGARTLEVTFTNPGANAIWLEQRVPGGIYQRSRRFDETQRAIFQLEADTTQSVCFRITLADTCLQAPPSAEVCYEPPKPPDPVPVVDSTVFLPDAFSPNADGINDRFVPKGLVGRPVRLTVFNRWGEVVFQSDDARDGWDGHQQNQPLPPGPYSYRMITEKASGERLEKRGLVLLMK